MEKKSYEFFYAACCQVTSGNGIETFKETENFNNSISNPSKKEEKICTELNTKEHGKMTKPKLHKEIAKQSPKKPQSYRTTAHKRAQNGSSQNRNSTRNAFPYMSFPAAMKNFFRIVVNLIDLMKIFIS